MATVYCVTADVDFVLSADGKVIRTDDNEDGTEDNGVVTNAIQIAAVEMNFYLERRYKLSGLTSNEWCKWANAYMAAYYLDTRLGNPAAPAIAQQRDDFIDKLKLIATAGYRVPETTEAFNFLPRMTNYREELQNRREKVVVTPETSVGPPPPSGVKRPQGLDFGGGGWYE